jgi:hypothetical protein
MIGMINHNRDCPVNLLGKHHPDQSVRPGHWAEREREIRRLPYRLGMAIRPTDEKRDLAGAPFDLAAQKCCEIGALQGSSGFIEEDLKAAGLEGCGQGLGFRFAPTVKRSSSSKPDSGKSRMSRAVTPQDRPMALARVR